MAMAVIGGLITSTLLTLFLVPVVYSYMDRLATRLRGHESRSRQEIVDNGIDYDCSGSASESYIAGGCSTAAGRASSVW